MTRHFTPSISRIFPLLAHWSNFSALGGMTAFAAGICAAGMTPLQPFLLHEQLYPVFLPAAILCGAFGIITGKKSFRILAFGAAGVMWCLYQTTQAKQVDTCIAELSPLSVRISGDIITPPEPRRDRFIFLLSLNELNGKRHPRLSGRTFLCTSLQNTPAAGSLVMEGIVRLGEVRKNRYDFDERAFLAANGIVGKIDAGRILTMQPPHTLSGRLAVKFRQRLMSVFKQYKNPDHRALIRASFTGEKAYIAPEIKEIFRRSGLYHLLALSGFHAAILLTAVYFLLVAFPVRSGIKHGVALLVLWLYLGFIGPIPSLTRAVIMASGVIVSMMFQRKNYPLQILGIAGLLWLVFSPLSLFQPGFQLSYGATFGILTLHPLLARLYRGFQDPVVDFFLRPLFMSVSVSISAFLMTLPILLYFFGCVSLYGIFANLAAVPLMSGAMWTFFTALLTGPIAAWAGRAAIFVSGGMIDCLLMIASFADKISFSLLRGYAPYPEIIAVFYIFLLAVITIERKWTPRFLAWGIPLLLCAIPADYLLHRTATAPTIIRFATDKDAAMTAMRWPRGSTWLFCSGKERAVSRALRNSVTGWIHHTPGTTIDRLFIAVPGEVVIDSSKEGVQRMSTIDSLKIVNATYRCTCCFVPDQHRSVLVASSEGSRLVSDHTGSAVIIRNAADPCQQTIAPPAAAVLQRNRFRLRRFD